MAAINFAEEIWQRLLRMTYRSRITWQCAGQLSDTYGMRPSRGEISPKLGLKANPGSSKKKGGKIDDEEDNNEGLDLEIYNRILPGSQSTFYLSDTFIKSMRSNLPEHYLAAKAKIENKSVEKSIIPQESETRTGTTDPNELMEQVRGKRKVLRGVLTQNVYIGL